MFLYSNRFKSGRIVTYAEICDFYHSGEINLREVIMLHIGQAGIAIANEFWKIICKEHYITTKGQVETGKNQVNGMWDVLFNKSPQTNRYYPSGILVDSDPTVIDKLKETKELFHPRSMLFGKSSAVTFPEGYNFGQKHEYEIMSMINELVNQSESLQGFILTHSISGGIGSGLAGWLLKKIKENFPQCFLMTLSVFPFQETSSAVAPYNALLVIEKLIEFPDFVVVIDNSSVMKVAKHFYDDGSFEVMNRLISRVCSGITASLRFKGGKLNIDLREFKMNLVPFPKLKFLTSAITPLEMNLSYDQITLEKLVGDVFDEDYKLVKTTRSDIKIEKKQSYYFASFIIFRGKVLELELKKILFRVKEKLPFIPYISTGIKYGLSPSPNPSIKGHLELSALHNHTSMKMIFEHLLNQFDLLYSKQAFLHKYFEAGMSQEQFKQARDATADLINEYVEAEK